MYKEAMLCEPPKGHSVHCFLCNLHCRIADGETGFCGVGKNAGGKLNTLADGKFVAANSDPIEKNHSIMFCPAPRSFPSPPWGVIFIAVSARTGKSLRSGKQI